MEKVFFSIKEVSKLLSIERSTIKYWESEFPHIAPKRTRGGDRLYNESNINDIKVIKHLLREKKMTIQGAKEELAKSKSKYDKKFEVIEKLKNIRTNLQNLMNSI